MNKKITGLLILVLVMAVFSSGCVSEEEDKEQLTCPSSCDDDNACTTDTCGEDTNYQCVHDRIFPCCGNGECEEGENLVTCYIDCKQSCSKNLDCDDGNICTTDSCINGVCKNVAEANCQVQEIERPYIHAVSFSDPEWIEIRGKNYDVTDWKVENLNGEVYFAFPDYYKVSGFVKIYTKSGLSTTDTKYAGIGRDFWNDTSDTAILRDSAGNLISQKS